LEDCLCGLEKESSGWKFRFFWQSRQWLAGDRDLIFGSKQVLFPLVVRFLSSSVLFFLMWGLSVASWCLWGISYSSFGSEIFSSNYQSTTHLSFLASIALFLAVCRFWLFIVQ
jgi:hypothetical protein